MNKRLDEAIARVKALPDDRQGEIAELLFEFIANDQPDAYLTPEQIAEIENAELWHEICPNWCPDQHRINDTEFYLVHDICFLSQLIVGIKSGSDLTVGRCFQADNEQVVPNAGCGEFRVIGERGRDFQRRCCIGPSNKRRRGKQRGSSR